MAKETDEDQRDALSLAESNRGDEIEEYRFYCPTCGQYSNHFETKVDFPTLAKAFNAIPVKTNECLHEGVELESRKLNAKEWVKETESDTPRVNPNK